MARSSENRPGTDWQNQLRGIAAEQGSIRDSEAPGARAPLVEIFSSVQGEGRFVGVPMVFVRTATCPLRCRYCDTTSSYSAPARFPVRLGPRVQHEANPATAARVAELVRLVWRGSPQSQVPLVSLTGGEPLVHAEFARELGAALREQGARLHLETAAIDPDSLARCVDQIDHLSADYKLPSTLDEPVSGPAVDEHAGYGAAHLECCERALRRGASVDVKIVITASVTDPEFELALETLRPLRRRIQLILQPVTPVGTTCKRPAAGDIERLLSMALSAGFETRLLPQIHKFLQLP